ncbi:MAG TPA: GDYXXLXY domain-containing protein, partial [Myxococcota bacterium]|nr:GDYXXLXY domain-containing protein [Myxococcota bacterium]
LFLTVGAGGVSFAKDLVSFSMLPPLVGPVVALVAVGWELHRRGALLGELGLVAGMGTLGIGALTWGNPGVCLGIAGLVLAYARRERAAFALAVVVLVGFGIRYYYQLNLDFYTKSGVLAASGAVLLGLRLYLRARGFLEGGTGEVAAAPISPLQRWVPRGVLLVWLVAFLGLYNQMIAAKEDLLRTAPRILLELAGRDPRSLMAGDYLRLDYAVARELRGTTPSLWDLLFRKGRGGRPDQTKDWDWEGLLVLKREPVDRDLATFTNEVPDAPPVYGFARLDDGRPPDSDELRVRYHRDSSSLWIGTDAFYMQEGSADRYLTATYAELAVGPEGDVVLIGLRGLSKEVLGQRLVP